MPSLHILPSICDAPIELFNASDSPFLQYAFWKALEESGATSIEHGWWAQHVLLRDDLGQALALLPLFVKNHNRGEYVFDHAWAQAYGQHGLDYYPRLVSSVPFTPVTGGRVWLASGVTLLDVWPTLRSAVEQIAQATHASSWHGLFVDPSTAATAIQHSWPLAVRHGCQFLWKNNKYHNFDGFLAQMTAKRRKMIKSERNKIAQMGIVCTFIEGMHISTSDWDFFYDCYAHTYLVRGQTPYLTPTFFEQLGRNMPQQLVLQIAVDAQGERLAAALFFKDSQTLYGRYWGALVEVPYLHFEVCYYQGIAYALAHGLSHFDPGTQGEHKLLRGFSPIITQSLHWLAQPQFMSAVQHYVARERIGVDAYIQEARAALPFKHNPP